MLTLKKDGSFKNKIFIASIFFMGAAHILYLKNYLKGLLFAAIEIFFIFNIPKILKMLYNLITLGEDKKHLPIKLRDNSILMLIDGVIILAVIFLFVCLYYISIKSALKIYKDYCLNIKTSKNLFSDIVSNSFPILGLVPTVILIVFFVVVPLIFSALVAFTNYSAPNNITPNNTVDWVGFDNFITLFSGNTTWSSAFMRIAIWTLIWGTFATITCYFGGMFVAIMLKEYKIKFLSFFRSIFILPYAVPSFISMLVWQNLLNGTFGTVNKTLSALGWINQPIPWLGHPTMAKVTLILINLWVGFPYFMLLISGTMTSISNDIFEASKIDGANKFQTFKSITLPLILYQTAPLLIMSFTHNINNFLAIFLLTGGNPAVPDTTTTNAGGTDILVTWIYKLTITLQKYNYASVLAVIIFLTLAPFAIYNFKKTKSYKDGEL